jgi:hypothetical protein
MELGSEAEKWGSKGVVEKSDTVSLHRPVDKGIPNWHLSEEKYNGKSGRWEFNCDTVLLPTSVVVA